MKRLGALAAFVVWVFGGAAVLAPWVWWLAQALAESMPGAFGWLAGHPFSRYVHRCLLVLGIVGIGPLIRAMHCGGREAIGWGRAPGRGLRVAWGLLAGFVCFAALVAIEVGEGTRSWKGGLAWGTVAMGIARGMVTAVVVSAIEETLFRGVAFVGLRPAVGGAKALVLSALLFAVCHFFGKPPSPARVGVGSGFETLAGMLGGFAEWGRFMPAFGTLFLLGTLLALSCWREGDLYFAFGLHAGLVFWVKVRGVLTETPRGSLSGGDFLSGWSSFYLAAVGVMVYSVLWYRGKREEVRGHGTDGSE